ncbi:hypothetical protein IV203_034837 [Nitzschia inconspicua]|uniref:Uncharacterized protein n=1 Tax=Nitzschia inconspicua TaxID=303405 RepID=A0A9K3LDK2_9STRA|nr:hypothetical protein IV203_034837 [Nitzschia inconspicua]
MTATLNNICASNRSPPKARPEGRPKWEPRLPEFYDDQDLKAKHPPNRVDHRPNGGPLLELLWCDEPLHGQTLYLGGEVGVDGKIYCIPGHSNRVLTIDPSTDKVTLIGPDLQSNGTKFKWLRGIPIGDVIYGLPCHASEVLRIHVPTQTITKIPIPYEEFYQDPQIAKAQRKCIWKYHGGSISSKDGCIYAVPQSALHVLKIDPTNDNCTLVGPELPGKYKWYGGVPTSDGAIYCVPQNSPHVLRIHPDKITLHGKWDEGGHKWHGAAKAVHNDVVVCIPNNVDRVLCITPNGDEPILTEIGDESFIQTGRHRTDRKYKYLGAMAGTNGKVYIFPSGSEYVLEVDTDTMEARNVGPNLRDSGMERIFQNKWQNGLTNEFDQCVYAIPLAGETVLRINCSKEDVDVTTWPLPSPYETLDKFEGGVLCPNGLIYTVPNNCKAVLKIQPCNWTPEAAESAGTTTENEKKKIASNREYGGKDDNLVYKSGIPTLRSSAHRVKFDIKSRKHDPKPVDKNGNETKTTWLPPEVQAEDVFAYDLEKYNLRDAVVNLLKGCDPAIVGSFEASIDGGPERLEDFRVPVNSIWRSVNGGCCEDAQKYLSDQVIANQAFLDLFDKFVAEAVLPYVKSRLVSCGALEKDATCTFYYQRPPTLRLQPGPGWAKVKPHNDAEYGHQNGELNIWLPLTDRVLTGVDLWSESSFQANDYHPIAANVGEAIAWHGSSRRHYVNANASPHTRVSFDFRIGVQGYFDPRWEMQGTTHDHTRKEIEI